VSDDVAVRPTDFFIQRGYATIPTGQNYVDIVAGTDYSAPASDQNAFIRIVSTRFSGVGHNSSGGTQDPDEYMVSIEDPEDLLSDITFRRYSSTAIYNTRIYWEIIEYQGTPGGKNEIEVLDQAEITQGAGVSMDGASVLASDNSDVVIFITGQRHNGAGTSSTTDRGLYTSEWVTADDLPRFTRGDGTGSSALSYAVVEFTGDNWDVQRVGHNYTASGVWQTETFAGVGDMDKTFIHAQMRTASGNLDEQGQQVELTATDTLSFRLDTGAGIFAQSAIVWVIENTQNGGTEVQVQRISGTRAVGGAEPDAWLEATTDVDRLVTTSIMGETASSDGGGSAVPRGSIGFLLGEGNVSLWRSDTGQPNFYSFEVVEWPIEYFNFPPGIPAWIQCDNSSDCNVTVSKNLQVEAGGAIDFEDDNLTYHIDASISNISSTTDLESSEQQAIGLSLQEYPIFYDDFNTDSGIWAYTGTCVRQVGDANCRDGNACIRCLGAGTAGEDGTAVEARDLVGYDDCQMHFYYRANSLDNVAECGYHRYFDGTQNDILQICDPNDDNIWHGAKYNYTSLGHDLTTNSQMKFSIEASGGADYWYIDNANLTCFDLPFSEENTTPVVYTNIMPGDFSNIDNITITVDVSVYDKTGSILAGNNDPDLALHMFDGTDYVFAGTFDITSTGNYSLVITDSSILSAWQEEENHDVTITGIDMEYFGVGWPDEINWTGLWADIEGSVWMSLGDHGNGTSLVWDTTAVPDQDCVDFRANVVDKEGSSQFDLLSLFIKIS